MVSPLLVICRELAGDGKKNETGKERIAPMERDVVDRGCVCGELRAGQWYDTSLWTRETHPEHEKQHILEPGCAGN